ncbi:alpha/beta hydrolase-fold protein [Ohtaekwangia sp.]|uniref:alpha/beta hydrolase-fold protein n=1 Tax=Ohtaekwangia sp. TaxID=2066019 RepID=UPI0039C8F594
MKRSTLLSGILLILCLKCTPDTTSSKLTFSITYTPQMSEQAQDGRLLLMLSNNNKAEPRFQINDGLTTQLIFGVDVEGLLPGGEVIVDSREAFGFPIQSLDDIPPGEYTVQALLNRYETYTLKTGHTVKLPPDQGEGQQWNSKPGNFYSIPAQVKIDPAVAGTIKIVMDQKIPPVETPKDSKYIRHVRIQSKLLSEFWGKPMYLGAHILLPEGFDEHPEAHYPLMVFHGHFPSDFGGFSTEPPPASMDTSDYNSRFNIYGYAKFEKQEAYNFYKQWTSKDFPRFLIIEIQHANPYYDDSYAVNSANLGPYGDAIMQELIPAVEKQFRGIGQGWARFMYGGSTGGWEALAAQIFYPDEFNGCFAACPDPIDFRAYSLVDIYKQKNAYWYDSPFKRVPIPSHRNYLGQIQSTMQESNHYELALGTHSRSGQQWDIWEAVYSPQGADGYPKRIFNKLTGDIDSSVAVYWKEHYDLRYILERDWKTLGPKLQGKIHLYCGDMDNYYLNNAVYLMEEFLKKTTTPFYKGEVDYGDRAEHCWNGDHNNPNYVSRLRYNTMYLPKILQRIKETAPRGADTRSWRY